MLSLDFDQMQPKCSHLQHNAKSETSDSVLGSLLNSCKEFLKNTTQLLVSYYINADLTLKEKAVILSS